MKRSRHLLASLVTATILCAGVAGSAFADSGADANLSALEKRFFEHSYPKDTTEARLERVEKMVFGEAKTGDESERLKNLLGAVPDLNASASNSSGDGSNAGSSDGLTKEPPKAAQEPTAPTITDSSDYPRVTALEQQLLGKTYPTAPVQDRLNRLEQKAFGKPSTSDDLSSRTDQLEQYEARKQGGNSSIASSSLPSAYTTGGLSTKAGIYEKVSWLEKNVYGHDNPNTSLVQRVKSLQSTITPNEQPNPNESLKEQVNSLVGAVELMPNKQTASGSGGNDAYNSGGSAYNSNESFANQSYGTGAYGAGGGGIGGNAYGGSNAYTSNNNTYGGSSGSTGSYTTAQNYPAQQQDQQQQQQHHNSHFLKGLAHVVGAVGGMALTTVGSMGGGYGMMPYGGMGGYGMPYGGYGGMGGYGMGGYGMPYGGGYGGMGGYGMSNGLFGRMIP